MTIAYVGDMNDGVSFSAHVEYREDVPFAYVHGPESVDAGAAVAWARARADKVIVRVGGDRFSAGKQPAGDLPDWVGPTAPATKATAPSEPTAWRVEAHINWLRPDTEDVAARFAAALGDQPGASGVGYDIRDFGLAVWFLIRALRLDANEVASHLLRSAWTATGIEAMPGTDFDVTSMSVRAAE